jgi:hypothetical protein
LILLTKLDCSRFLYKKTALPPREALTTIAHELLDAIVTTLRPVTGERVATPPSNCGFKTDAGRDTATTTESDSQLLLQQQLLFSRDNRGLTALTLWYCHRTPIKNRRCDHVAPMLARMPGRPTRQHRSQLPSRLAETGSETKLRCPLGQNSIEALAKILLLQALTTLASLTISSPFSFLFVSESEHRQHYQYRYRQVGPIQSVVLSSMRTTTRYTQTTVFPFSCLLHILSKRTLGYL